MPQEKILVTGATGHVGSHFVSRAVKAGYAVRALVRSTSNTSLFEHLPVELAEGDLAKPETLTPALEDVDLVIHSGAHVGDWGPAETYRLVLRILVAQNPNQPVRFKVTSNEIGSALRAKGRRLVPQ